MSTTTGTAAEAPDDVVQLRRTMIDRVLIGFGLIATLVFALAGALLTWGASFSADYVRDELASQNVFFPDEASLREEGRDDLVKWAGEQVTTGEHAEGYASYIGGHLEGIADGKTYSEIDDRGAAAAVEEAKASGADEATIEELTATANQLKGQRETLFRGETLRGLLLTSFAWSTVGRIAGISAIVMFVGAAVMLALSIAGVIHVRRERAA